MMLRNNKFEHTVEIETSNNAPLNDFFLLILSYGIWNLIRFRDSARDCVRDSFFDKVVDLRPATLLKKRLWHRCLAVNFAIYLKIPFSTEHISWLLLVFLEKREGH